MHVSLIKGLSLSLLSTLVLTACGGPSRKKAPRAIGVDSKLGQLLTSSRWCSAPTDPRDADGKATVGAKITFDKLDVRQDSTYIKTVYTITLEKVAVERGTWGLVGDQFFTRAPRGLQTRQKVAPAATNDLKDSVLPTLLAPRDAAEPCLTLADASGVAQTYCACVVK